MSPVWWEAHLGGMNYFCVHMTVFIPPNIPPQWDELCKYGVFEIFFVINKQTALCIRL